MTSKMPGNMHDSAIAFHIFDAHVRISVLMLLPPAARPQPGIFCCCSCSAECLRGDMNTLVQRIQYHRFVAPALLVFLDVWCGVAAQARTPSNEPSPRSLRKARSVSAPSMTHGRSQIPVHGLATQLWRMKFLFVQQCPRACKDDDCSCGPLRLTSDLNNPTLDPKCYNPY